MKVSMRILLMMMVLVSIVNVVFANQNHDTPFADVLIDGTKVDGDDRRIVLRNISTLYKIPMGVEIGHSTFFSEKAKAPDGRLADVLNDLLGTSYRWDVVDGVINISPTDSNSQIKDLLSTTVADFNFISQPGIMGVGEAIFTAREVEIKLQILGLEPVQIVSVKERMEPKMIDKLQHKFEKATVRQILNWAVRVGERKFWQIVPWGETNFITIVTF